MSKTTPAEKSGADILEEAQKGNRCRICLTKSEPLEETPQVPTEYQTIDADNGRKQTFCNSCRTVLDTIFDETFFHKAALIQDALRENKDPEQIDELPVDTYTDDDPRDSPDSCTICGLTDPRVIEEHHPFPRRHLPSELHSAFDLIALCGNCHYRIEDVYDDYFFEQIGINTGIKKQDDTETQQPPQSLPTVRSLTKDFVKEKCRHSEGTSIRHRELTKAFHKYLGNRGYEYNAAQSCIHRTIDEFTEYATWVHDPENANYEVRSEYWGFGRFDDLTIPDIDVHTSPPQTRTQVEESQPRATPAKPKPTQIPNTEANEDAESARENPLEERTLNSIETGHGDLVSIELYGLEYSTDLDVLAVAIGVVNNADAAWKFEPDDTTCMIDRFSAGVKTEGYFDGIPGSWNFTREEVAPGREGLFVLFVESPPGTTLTGITYEGQPAYALQDGSNRYEYDDRETVQVDMDEMQISGELNLPTALDLDEITIE